MIYPSHVELTIKVTVGTNAHDAVTLTWEKDEEVLQQAALTDGLFVLLTNHLIEAVDANELLTRYRGRNDIEMSHRSYQCCC